MSKKSKIVKDTIISDKMNDDALRAYSRKKLMAAANSNAADHDNIPAEENNIVLSLGSLLQDAYQIGASSNLQEDIKISLFGQKIQTIRSYYNSAIKQNPYLIDAANNDIQSFIAQLEVLPDGARLMRIVNKVGEDVRNAISENRLALPTLQMKQQTELNNKIIENNNYNTETLQKQLIRNNRQTLNNLRSNNNNDDEDYDDYDDNNNHGSERRGPASRALDYTPSPGAASSTGFNSAQSAQQYDDVETLSDENTNAIMDNMNYEIENIDTYDQTELDELRVKAEDLINELQNQPNGDKNAARLISMSNIFIKLVDGKKLTHAEKTRIQTEKDKIGSDIKNKKNTFDQDRNKALGDIDTEEAALDAKLGIEQNAEQMANSTSSSAISNFMIKLGNSLINKPASPEKVKQIKTMIDYLSPAFNSTGNARASKLRKEINTKQQAQVIPTPANGGALGYFKNLLMETETDIKTPFNTRRAAINEEYDNYKKEAETEEEALNEKLGIVEKN